MFVQLGDQRIFFDVAGAKLAPEGAAMREKPTLIVMHGGPGFDHSSFRPDFDAFADIAQIVYFDHRGNGRSAPSDPATWTLAQWGDDVRALCETLGIVKPVVLGQSFGGMVAQAYATRYPDHAGALILSSTAARMDFPASLALFEAKGGAEARAIAERFWSEGSDEVFAAYMRKVMPLYNTRARPDAADARARAVVRPEVYRHFSLPGREIHCMDFRAALKSVTCPTLVLAGAEDPITPPHLAREIAASLGNPGTLRVYDDCSHAPFRDRPAPAFADIRAFIGGL